MGNILAFLKTWSVLIVLVAGIAFNLGVVAGWWPLESSTWQQVDTILIFAGLGSVRAKLEDLFAGIDLGSVGLWITGKKTYLLAGLMVVFNIGQAFNVWTVTTPIWVFINQLAGILGIGTFMSAVNTYKAQVKLHLASGTLPMMFKRAAVIAFLMLMFAPGLQAQTFEHFWHPRPKVMPMQMAPSKVGEPIVVIGNSILEFKPTAEVRLTEIAFGQNGASTAATFLNAFGPALTMQHSTQDAYGVNYADWSVSLAFLASGTTTQAPVFVPEVALTVGFLNNLIQVGPSYALTQPDPNYSRIRVHVGVGINVTQN